ncbi:Biosynthetic peptidoglycan transglycosylase [bacterium HR40]|nr:Biosynthetic peptidoglycan transglycosylase [bacterium HR40]
MVRGAATRHFRLPPSLRLWPGRLLRGTATAALAVVVFWTGTILALRWQDPPTSALMLLRRLEGHAIDHRPVPLSEVAPVLRFAVVAAEDNRFCSHAGFDWQALKEQIARWREGRRPRGASTLSQQTVKNLFLWPGRDPLRKLLEIPLTAMIELAWPKRRILEIYLQIVEFGPGIFGAEAAARRYYGRSARQLSPRQAASLAAILPSPLTRRPSDRAVQNRATLIERRIGQLGPLLDCVR